MYVCFCEASVARLSRIVSSRLAGSSSDRWHKSSILRELEKCRLCAVSKYSVLSRGIGPLRKLGLGLDIRSADFLLLSSCVACSRARESNLGLVPHKGLPETIAVVTQLLNNRR